MNAVQVEMSEQEATFGGSGGALREEAAARLAAHRERRVRGTARVEDARPVAGPREVPASRSGERAGRVAALVAERYAQTQSYRAFLAAEAENSVRLAHAAAEVAARNAEAIEAARRVLLVELEEMAEAPAPAEAYSAVESWPAVERTSTVQAAAEAPLANSAAGGLTVRVYEDAGQTAREAGEAGARPAGVAQTWTPGRVEIIGTGLPAEDDDRMLDEEIAYRQSPMEDLARTSVAIPGNLLEFPRLLVAARKARPRYAEGPLREDADAPDSQLRIFEVEAVQTDVPIESSAPEWSSIWLDALVEPAPEERVAEAEYPMAQRPETAALSLRVMAAVVDGCLIAAAYVLFATIFVYQTAALPGIAVALGGSAGVLGCLYLLYQMLFSTLSEATPGMRYARIGLCTFADENPSRAAIRRRVYAEMLAACPLGLGLLWACLDDDRLGWHDRMSRMYPRAY